MLLRIGLAFVNTEANDPHLPVIGIIAFENRFPERLEAWEAFQPKLYHVAVAVTWRAMPGAPPETLNRIAQLVSCAAGIAVLFVLLRFLRQVRLDPRARVVVFALVALNPQLIGISAQATNDTFVTLFASLALYSAWLFFRDGRNAAFAGMVISSVLAGLSKGNGLVVIIAVLLMFAAALHRNFVEHRMSRRRIAAYGLLFAVLVVPGVWEIGPYGYHQRTYGSPFVTNWEPSSRPQLWRQTYVERPGLTSVAHGLLTFRFVDLLRQPFSTDGRMEFPAHRSSLWTRLHAQAHSIHFESYPYSWRNRSWGVVQLGRAVIVLGLLPTLLLGWKLAAMVANTVFRAWVRHRRAVSPEQLLAVLVALGYLGFVVLYSMRLRDYSSMKFIFVMPGVLGFAWILGAAIEDLHARLAQRGWLVATAQLAIAALLIGYVIDVLILIRTLAALPG